MQFKARARHPGQCVLKGCTLPGDKIFENDALRMLACTKGHADAVERGIAALRPAGMGDDEWNEKQRQALRVWKERA